MKQIFYLPLPRVLKKSAILLGVIAVNLILLELLFRAVHSVYPLEIPARAQTVIATHWLQGFDTYNGKTRLYHYQPNSVGVTHGNPVRINNWGFRGPNFSKRSEVRSGLFRIMFLGDSVLMGQGVAERERFTDQLQMKIRTDRPNTNFEILNLGVQGFETLQELKMATIMEEPAGPDLVVVAFWTNDPNIHYRHYPPIRLPLPHYLDSLRRLMIVRLADSVYDWLAHRIARIPTHDQEVQQAYNPASEDWKIFEKAVEGLGGWAKKVTGRAPVALHLPDPIEAEKRGRYIAVKNVFIKNGFDWVESSAGAYHPVSRWDTHPSASSHAAYAEAMYRYLKEKDLPPATER
jgi:hypothetical protein